MRNFEDLEGKFRNAPIESLTEKGASGFLSLAGTATEAVLISENMLSFRSDENGWFDLQLKSHEGGIVELHNALFQGREGSSTGKWTNRIYPNEVIFFGRKPFSKVRSISFRMEGLKTFFRYNAVEAISLGRSDKSTRKFISQMRAKQARELNLRMHHDFNRPSEVFVAHQVPRAFRARGEIAYYDIGSVRTMQGFLGRSDISLQTDSVATIRFHSPCEWRLALESIWIWRQFFVQVGFQKLRFNSVGGRKGRTYKSESADVYLPNVRRDGPSVERAPHPRDIPYNEWKDRQKHAEVLEKWLQKQPTLATFRSLVCQVVEAHQERSDLQDIVRLCSAVESLSVDEGDHEFSKHDISKMSVAAVDALQQSGREVNNQRIRDVLSMLRRPLFSRKLDVVMSRCAPLLDGSQIMTLKKEVLELRNRAAHGAEIEGVSTRITPVVQALAGVCVLYDLLDCGLPLQNSHGMFIPAAKAVRQAMMSVKRK